MTQPVDLPARLAVDPTSTTPPYEQVRAGVAALVATGDLPAGTRLPAVRSLATDLGLAAGTVARAYRLLEESGVVETRGRGGTVVAFGTDEVTQQAHAAATAYRDRVRELGLADEEALDLVRRLLSA